MEKEIFLALSITTPPPICISTIEILNKNFSCIEESSNISEYHVPYNFNIMKYEEGEGGDLGEGLIVGVIEGWIIKTGWIDWKSDKVLDAFDKISDELVNLYEVISNSKIIQKLVGSDDGYYLSKIEINNDFRNQKIGTLIFELLMKTFDIYFKMSVEYILLKAFPLEYEGKYSEDDPGINKVIENAEKRLFAFYERVGFRKISKKHSYMIYQ